MQMYVEYGTLVYLSMSADATCRGLRSPKDGPLVMELTGGTCIGHSSVIYIFYVCVYCSAFLYVCKHACICAGICDVYVCMCLYRES